MKTTITIKDYDQNEQLFPGRIYMTVISKRHVKKFVLQQYTNIHSAFPLMSPNYRSIIHTNY